MFPFDDVIMPWLKMVDIVLVTFVVVLISLLIKIESMQYGTNALPYAIHCFYAFSADVSVSPKESYDFKYINEICCTF